MEEKIIKLIQEYLKNRKIVDSKFVERVIEIAVKNKQLNDYIKKVDYVVKKELIVKADITMYRINSKTIWVNLSKLLKQLIEEQILLDSQIDPITARFNFYLHAVQVILYEIEKVCQIDKAKSKTLTEESILLRIALIKKSSDEYSKNYSIDPIERMAQIESYRFMYKILEKANQKSEATVRIKKYIRLRLIEEEIKGYEINEMKIIGPTLIYLEKYQEEKLKKYFQCCKMQRNLKNSLYLGVNISLGAYLDINSEINKLTLELKRPN